MPKTVARLNCHVTGVCEILHKPTPNAHPWQTCVCVCSKVFKYHDQLLNLDACERLQVGQCAEIKTRIRVNEALNEAVHNSFLCVFP